MSATSTYYLHAYGDVVGDDPFPYHEYEKLSLASGGGANSDSDRPSGRGAPPLERVRLNVKDRMT